MTSDCGMEKAGEIATAAEEPRGPCLSVTAKRIATLQIAVCSVVLVCVSIWIFVPEKSSTLSRRKRDYGGAGASMLIGLLFVILFVLIVPGFILCLATSFGLIKAGSGYCAQCLCSCFWSVVFGLLFMFTMIEFGYTGLFLVMMVSVVVVLVGVSCYLTTSSAPDEAQTVQHL